MRTLPLSEVKARLSELADDVHRTHDRVVVTRNGRDVVVLVSVADFDSLEATIELLADPGARERLRQAEADAEAGDLVTLDDLAELLAERRLRDR